MLRSLASFVCTARGAYVNPLRSSSDHVVRSWRSASRRECASVPTSRAALRAFRQSSKCYHTQHYRSFSTQDSKSASEPEQSERSLAAAQSGSEAAAQRVVERLGIIPESATAASAESLNESALLDGTLMESHMDKTSIDSYDEHGYVINGIDMKGSVMAFPNFSLLWKPTSFQQVTAESLAVLAFVTPPTQILLLGADEHDIMLSPQVMNFLNSIGVEVQISDVFTAAATFNVLTQEDRPVVAALIATGKPLPPPPPPRHDHWRDAKRFYEQNPHFVLDETSSSASSKSRLNAPPQAVTSGEAQTNVSSADPLKKDS